jgi:hypothetical protein
MGRTTEMKKSEMAKELLSSMGALNAIASAMWCMDRGLRIISAVNYSGNVGLLDSICRRADALWGGPGESWNFKALTELQRACMDDPDLAVQKRDGRLVSSYFGSNDLVSDDHLVNAATNTISMVSSVCEAIKREGLYLGLFDAVVSAYEDIFYQPTWDELTRGKSEVSPFEMRQVRLIQEDTNPLKAALEDLLVHLKVIRGYAVVTWGDNALRGRE